MKCQRVRPQRQAGGLVVGDDLFLLGHRGQLGIGLVQRGELIEQRPVSRVDFVDTEYLQYFEQALIDSEVFLYELEEPDGEDTEGTGDAS